jgi:hypothetical protein
MGGRQEAAWIALLELHERVPDEWTLIGGQMVHLHCAERGYEPRRSTNDADAVVNARAPEILGSVTRTLVELGFDPGRPSAEGIQHRWTRDGAVIDVLIPEGTGERASKRHSASGFPTVAAPGGTQALQRSEAVAVQVGDRTGTIRRPMLLSAMILKAAARIETTGPALDRHCHDFATLAAIMAASDTSAFSLQRKDKQRLRTMIEMTRATPKALEQNPNAEGRLLRLQKLL